MINGDEELSIRGNSLAIVVEQEVPRSEQSTWVVLTPLTAFPVRPMQLDYHLTLSHTPSQIA